MIAVCIHIFDLGRPGDIVCMMGQERFRTDFYMDPRETLLNWGIGSATGPLQMVLDGVCEFGGRISWLHHHILHLCEFT